MDIRQEAFEETYYDLEQMVHRVVHGFLVKHGISHEDYQEWAGEGMLGFVQAYHTVDYKRARLTTWAWINVRNALLGKLKKELPYYKQLPLPDDDELEEEYSYCLPTIFGDTIECLSDDAKLLVRFSLAGISVDTQPKTVEQIRSGLCESLLALGWSLDRVAETFHEIRRALE